MPPTRKQRARTQAASQPQLRPSLWPLALAALFLIALLWRLAYLGRLARTPFESTLTMDARIYWDWAGFLLRAGPVGKNPFFMGPLYPYVLTVLRGALGDVHHVLIVQAVWGAAAVTLLADAARRLAGPAIGIAIGLLLAFYRMAVFLDGLVLMESLLFALEALLLWIVVRSTARGPGWRTALLIGVIVGTLAEGRATATLLLVPAAALLIEIAGTQWRARGLRLAALAGGFLLLIAPAAIRNAAVSGEWIPFTYNSGFNLHVGNGPESGGGFALSTSQIASPVPEDGGIEGDGREYIRKTTGKALGPNASSAWWTERALDWIRAHPGPAGVRVLQRLGMMWNRREYPQIENAQVYEVVAGPLGLPFAVFALLGVLAIAGLPFAWRHGPAGRFLVGYALVTTFAILPFFVTDRYRHHLVPAGALLAAIALDRLRRALASRQGRFQIGAALAAGVLIVNLPAPSLSGAKQAWGTYFDIGTRWMEQGRPDLAIPQYEHALEMERKGQVRRLPGVAAAVERAGLYYDYARALRLVGREPDALPWLERAVSEAPEGAPQLSALADVLHRMGRDPEAAAVEARLARVAGGEGRTLLARGWRAAAAGQPAEAESLFDAATRADPSLFDAWTAQVRIQVERNELPAAHATLERAHDAGLPPTQYHAHAALVLAAQGDIPGAESELLSVPAGAEQGDPIVAEVMRNARMLMAPRH